MTELPAEPRTGSQDTRPVTTAGAAPQFQYVEEFVRFQLGQSLGGTRGMVESALPFIAFTIAWVIGRELYRAVGAAVATALVLAAINVLVFEVTDGRTIQRWDQAPSAPPLGRAIAAVSLVVWVAVIVSGRMIGFTTTRASLAEPAPVETNFEDLLGLPPDSGNTAPPSR